MNDQDKYTKGMEYLIDVIQKLSLAQSLEDVIEITRHAARTLTGADGAAFVLRDHGKCYYVDEDAIGPLWKGKRFPLSECISGWSMLNREVVAIEDVFADQRIPLDSYRPTFVKSLLVVPIRQDQPIGAIGNYWAHPHKASQVEMRLLKALADSTSIALENVQHIQSLKEANAILGDSIQARDEFFSIASHELRTPITAIKLQLQISERKLLRMHEGEPEYHSPLSVSLEQAEKLASLTNQLLDVSRIRLGKMNLEKTHTNCSELFRNYILKKMPELQAAGCKVQWEIPEGIYAMVDSQKCEQIIGHLFSNIERHAPGSNVTVSLVKEEDRFILKVKDTGPGIDPEILDKIFQRFERVQVPRKLGGLGLGLFLAKSLVEAHQGEIKVESSAGSGALFEACIPIRPDFFSRDRRICLSTSV